MGTTFRPSMDGIEHGDHTADLWLEARGKDLLEMMGRMIEGVYGVIASEFEVHGSWENQMIKISGPDRESVFVDLLNEVLFFFDAESRIVKLLEIEENVRGEDEEFTFILDMAMASVSSGKGGMEVKAATHHDASIHDEGKVIAGRVLLDL